VSGRTLCRMDRFVWDHWRDNLAPDRFAGAYLSPEGGHWINPSYGIKIDLVGGGFRWLNVPEARYPVRGSNPLSLYILRYYPNALEIDDEDGIWCSDGRVLRKAVDELNAWNDRASREGDAWALSREEAARERRATVKLAVWDVLQTLPNQRYRGRAKRLREMVLKLYEGIEREYPVEIGSFPRFLELLRIWINDSKGEITEFLIEEKRSAGRVYLFTLTALPEGGVSDAEVAALLPVATRVTCVGLRPTKTTV
jgi:hypothetical protein